jgi:hypothetical protein
MTTRHRLTNLLFVIQVFATSLAYAQTNGPLRVHPENPRYFADASGKAVLLTGSHTWPNLIDMGPTDPPAAFDFDGYLKWLKSHGHNFTRGWTWEPTRWNTSDMKNVEWRNGHHFIAQQPYLRTGPGLALDGKAKFDLEKPNPEYLQRIRERLAKTREAGIYVSVMLFEGFGVQYGKESWSNHPMNAANNINGVEGDRNSDRKGIEIHQLLNKRVTKLQEAYLRWLVTGLNEFDNVLYEVSNETHTSSTEWQYHIIRTVKTIEATLPNQHPVGMTFQASKGKNQALFDSPADWISPNPEGGFRDNPPDMKGIKVVMSDTDHLWGIGGDAVWVWKTFTRGLNPIFMDTYDGKVLGKVRPQDDAPRRTMGHVLALSKRIHLARAIPQPESSSTGFCLSEPGKSYVVFAPEGGDIEVDLTQAPAELEVERLHPVTGEVSIKETIAGGARRRFSTPANEPCVLLLLPAAHP